MKKQPGLTAKAKLIALAIIDSYEVGALFTTAQFSQAVYEAYQGPDKDEQCNTLPQNKVKHVARWAQQTAKAEGLIASLSQQGYWVKLA